MLMRVIDLPYCWNVAKLGGSHQGGWKRRRVDSQLQRLGLALSPLLSTINTTWPGQRCLPNCYQLLSAVIRGGVGCDDRPMLSINLTCALQYRALVTRSRVLIWLDPVTQKGAYHRWRYNVVFTIEKALPSWVQWFLNCENRLRIKEFTAEKAILAW